MKKLLSQVFTKEWLIAAGIRALKTVAQAAVATVGTSYVLESVDWKFVLSASAMAGLLSLLTSIAGLPELTIQDVPEITVPENVETDFAAVDFIEKEEKEENEDV